MRSAPPLTAWLTAIVVVAAAALALGARGAQSTAAAPAAHNPFLPGAIGSRPFSDSQLMFDVGRAADKLGLRIRTPNTQLANATTLTRVWYTAIPNDSGSFSRMVELDYPASRLRIEYSRRLVSSISPGTIFAARAAALGRRVATVQRIGAVPALVRTATAGRMASVDLVVGQVEVVVSGERPTADLVKVAATIAPAAPESQNASFTPGPIGTRPFATAQRLTLGEASRRVGFRIITPRDALARPAGLRRIWFAGFSGGNGAYVKAADLDYPATSVRVQYALPRFPVIAPRALYRQKARALGLPARAVRTVHGVPALVIPAGARRPGSVDLTLFGISVTVTGTRPLSDLIAVARSIPVPDQFTAEIR